jgi:hypothetical protein
VRRVLRPTQLPPVRVPRFGTECQQEELCIRYQPETVSDFMYKAKVT